MKREAATLTVKTTTTSTLSITWADVRAVLAEHYAAVLGMPVESLTVGLVGWIDDVQVYASDDLDNLRLHVEGTAEITSMREPTPLTDSPEALR